MQVRDIGGTGYYINKNSGKIEITGTLYTHGDGYLPAGTYYNLWGGRLYRYQVIQRATGSWDYWPYFAPLYTGYEYIKDQYQSIVTSKSPTAYPNNDVQNGFWYIYIGYN